MRNLFIIGMLGVAAFTAGWFNINREGDSTTIEINRAEIRQDARRAIDRGREILDRRDQQFASQDQAQPNFDEQSYGPQSYGNPPAYQNQPAPNQAGSNQAWNQNYGRPDQQQQQSQFNQGYAPQQGGYYQGQAPNYNDQRR